MAQMNIVKQIDNKYFPDLVHSIDMGEVFFQKHPQLDTLKVSLNGMSRYYHNCVDEVLVFKTKNALRKRLSQENRGKWTEERLGKKRYFVDESHWFQSSFKEVSEDDFLQRKRVFSTMGKIVFVSLGILIFIPKIPVYVNSIPKDSLLTTLKILQNKIIKLEGLGLKMEPIFGINRLLT